MNIKYCFKENLLAKNDNCFLCYYRGCLYLKNENYVNIKKIRIHKWYKSFTLLERLFRKEPRIAIPLNNHMFMFSDSGYVYILDLNNYKIDCIHKYSKGMNNPLSFCTRKNEFGKIIEVLYGEYIWNENKGPVSIYKYDFVKWSCVYTFPNDTITHIHNITFDYYKNRYIILTGDEDTESAIWEADVDFISVKKIIGGNQKYRSCVCFPTKDGIFYATDTPLEENSLFFLRNDNTLKKISSINGPCIYGTVLDNFLFFSTSVEGDPTVGKIRYRLLNKLGKGVKNRFVHIMSFNVEKGLEKLYEIKKDALPMWLFQFGNAKFITDDNNIYFSTQSTVKKGTFIIER